MKSCLIITAGILTTLTHAQKPVNTPTLTVRQVNKDGFGDINNRYAWAMAEFKDSLYVGTLNAVRPTPGLGAFFLGFPFETNGAQIWRGDKVGRGFEWTQVVTGGNGNIWNYGVRKMSVVGDYMYAVTANHVTGMEVWRTSDGDWWQKVVEGGFGDVENTSGRGLTEFDGYLYVGVENRKTGAKIIRRAVTEEGDFEDVWHGHWEVVVTNGFDDTNNYWVSDFVEFVGYKYVGTLNMFGMQLWRTQDGQRYEMVFDKGYGRRLDIAAMKLYVYNDDLYIGTMNWGGASLLVSSNDNGTEFETVFTGGNGDRNNAYMWYLQEFNERLYVGTFKTLGEFDIISAQDPKTEDFTTETNSAFGNEEQYGCRTMAIFEDKLMFGSATSKNEQSCKIFEADIRQGQPKGPKEPKGPKSGEGTDTLSGGASDVLNVEKDFIESANDMDIDVVQKSSKNVYKLPKFEAKDIELVAVFGCFAFAAFLIGIVIGGKLRTPVAHKLVNDNDI